MFKFRKKTKEVNFSAERQKLLEIIKEVDVICREVENLNNHDNTRGLADMYREIDIDMPDYLCNEYFDNFVENEGGLAKTIDNLEIIDHVFVYHDNLQNGNGK